MRYRSSIETSLKILTILARDKECAQYDMPKKIRKDYRTILRHLQDLKKHGLILLSRTEPASKGGIDKKIYTLTEAGLIAILGYQHIYDYIGQVAVNYRSVFPLIFGKWQFFIENDCGDIAVQRLKDTIRLAYKYIGVNLSSLFSEEHLGQLEKVKPEAEKVGFEPFDAIDDITKHFLLFPVVTSFSPPLAIFPEDLEKPHHAIEKKWMNMLKRDTQLKMYIEKKLVIEYKHAKRGLEAKAAWLDYEKKN